VNKTNDDQRYDSLFPGEHFTVFVQEDQAAANTSYPVNGATYPTHGQSGALTTYVYQSASAPVTNVTAVQEIANGVYFEMYPNPTSGNTTIAYNIAKSQNVTVEVFNTLGERVYYTNEGTMSSGDHSLLINGQTLNSGVYFVRFTTDNVTTTKKLVIQK
jgi:esterase/lipase superfamily enzyme